MSIMILKIINVIFFLVVLFISLLLIEIAKKKNSLIPVVFIIIIISLICGLRGINVGIDTKAYYKIIESGCEYGHIYDIGFIALINLLLKITTNVKIILVIISCITNSCILCSLWAFRDKLNFSYVFICFYAFCYFKTFSGIRQWIAVALFFVALCMLIKYKKLIFALLITIFSATFHFTGILGMPIVFSVYLMQKKRNMTFEKKIVVSMVCIAVMELLLFITYYFIGDIIIIKAENYIGELLENRETRVGIFQLIKIMIYIAVVFNIKFSSEIILGLKHSCEIVQRSLSKDKDNTCWKITVLMEGIVLLIGMLGYYSSTIGRLNWYFMLFDIFFYSILMDVRDKERLVPITIPSFMVVIVFLFGELTDLSILYFS